MKIATSILCIMLLVWACTEEMEYEQEPLRSLTLSDIKREYAIADSLNNLGDRGNLDNETKILGVDARNKQIIIRTCGTRGFGCLLFSKYYTLIYLDSDSTNCVKNGGLWLVDHVGFAGARSVVGCAPDTINSISGCGCN